MAKDSGSSSWAKRDHEPPVDGQHPEGSNATIGLAKEKTAHFFCRSDKESEAVQVARNLVDIVPGRPSAEPGRSSDRVVNGTGSKHPGMERVYLVPLFLCSPLVSYPPASPRPAGPFPQGTIPHA